jgi:hypothetical protein
MAGQMWALAETLAMQFLYPFFYRRVSENQKQAEIELAFSDLLNTLVPVYLVLTGLLVLSAPYLLIVLVASQFQGALTFVALGAGIELCRVLGNLLSNAAHVKRQTKTLALPYAAGSMTALALIYFASASQLEISGAGAALMAGGLTMLTVMLFCMHLQVRITIDAARWFWSVAVMLALAAPVFYMPTMSSLGASIGMLMLIAVPACIAVVALLWKNPATLRLLDVQLLKN